MLCLLGSSWLWQFLRFSLFLISLIVLRSTGQVCCRRWLHWDLSLFLMIGLGFGVLEGWPHGPRVPIIKMTSQYWCWPGSPSRVADQASPLLNYSPFILYFSEESHRKPILEDWEVMLPPIWAECLSKWFGVLLRGRLVFSSLLIYSVIYLYHYRFIGVLGVIIQHCFILPLRLFWI